MTQRTPNVHFGGHRLQTPPKFHEKTPRESTKSAILGGGGKKKSEILGGRAVWGLVSGGLAQGSRAGYPAGGPEIKKSKKGIILFQVKITTFFSKIIFVLL